MLLFVWFALQLQAVVHGLRRKHFKKSDFHVEVLEGDVSSSPGVFKHLPPACPSSGSSCVSRGSVGQRFLLCGSNSRVFYF